MMVNRVFNEKVKNALSEKKLDVTKAQMEQMLLLAKIQLRKNSKKRIGFWELMMYQIRFIGIRIWSIEIIMVSVLMLILRSSFLGPYVFTPRKAAFLLSCGIVTASMFLLPFLYRSAHFLMMEIEGAAYFSIRKILISRFFLFFGGEIIIAAAVCIIAYVRQFMEMNMVSYVLLPLLLTGNGILFFLKNTSPEKMCRYYVYYAGMLISLLLAGYYSAPWIFDGRLLFLPIWSGAALLACFIYQCNRLMKGSEETLYA